MTVTVAGPKVAVLEAASVKTVLAPVVEVGLNVAVTPLGKPLAVNATLPVKPPVRVMLIVLVPLVPRVMVKACRIASQREVWRWRRSGCWCRI